MPAKNNTHTLIHSNNTAKNNTQSLTPKIFMKVQLQFNTNKHPANYDCKE